MYRKIVNVQALFVVFMEEERNTIIGRSGTESIHIGKIMQTFGGGGHAGAGSASVKLETTDHRQIRQLILDQLQATKTEQAVISDIMSFPVVSVSPETTMREAQEIMAKEQVRGVLVMEGDAILGIIVLWDLKKVRKERQWLSPVKAFMARQVITITVQTSPTEAARLMIEKDVGYLPVLQEGKVVGIVTRTDILTYYYDLLPD
jgi:CBS domain-containing protein